MLQNRYWFMTLILLVAIAAACTPALEPGAAPTDDPEQMERQTPVPDQAEQVAAEALPAARLALADYLNVAPDALELEKIEDAEWPNACLGLAQSGEMCAEVITPGYAIAFTTEGESYPVRTDRSGELVRVEAAARGAPADELPPAVAAARTTLARQLDLEPSAIEVLSYEQQEWSDSCLGLGGAAEICAAVITPGWQVMLGTDGQVYEVRSDETGQQVRVADGAAGQPDSEIPAPQLGDAVLFYQRSGGITGEVVTVRVYPDGRVERVVGPPEPNRPVDTVARDAAAVEALLADLEAAGYFELGRSYLPQDTCCDRYLYLMSVRRDAGVHTVEALDATPDTPASLWQSVNLVEEFIAETFRE